MQLESTRSKKDISATSVLSDSSVENKILPSLGMYGLTSG